MFSTLTIARMRIVRVGGPELACERMVTTMPQVVVTLGLLLPQQRADLGDHAAAVGAVMVELDPELDPDTLDQLLTNAVEEATNRTRRNNDEELEELEEVGVDVSVDTIPPPAEDGADTDAPKAADADEIDENW